LNVRAEVLKKLSFFASQTRRSVQDTEQVNRQLRPNESSGSTYTISGEVVNWNAEHLLSMLERELARLDEALSSGGWQTFVILGAATPAALSTLCGIAAGALGGKNSFPEPIRVTNCRSGSTAATEYQTYLTSAELSLMLNLPREEVPGYFIQDYVQFDTHFQGSARRPVILGNILQDNQPSGQRLEIDLDDLSKHGVIVGVTGSGKTTSTIALLDSAYKAGVPFCVIEPAKTEYRTLLGAISNGRATGPISDLQVYSLGNETLAPFRLNPFEFELGDSPGDTSLLAHIDHLKAVFNAAFILYAPMPYVLETALHQVYEDKGWDLATGINMRLPETVWENRHQFPIFPTLSDLYRKIDEVVAVLGYDRKIEQDVQAGLKARIGSLRLGSKGLLLDTVRGLPIADLLSAPTILELESLGNDDEKTFLIGLLLIRFYEYRRTQAALGKLPSGLQHLIVIEEAHRLLAKTSTQVDTESANPRAQAVETFVNMLSEIRAYKQGVLVAEQIPEKLTPDIIKNTNLKIVHRLLAADDREMMAHTMNMSDDQSQYLSVLRPGVATVYMEGADHPYLTQMNDPRGTLRLSPPSDAILRQYSPSYIHLEPCATIPNLRRYGVRCGVFGTPDAPLYQMVTTLLEQTKPATWAQLILIVIHKRERLPQWFLWVDQYIERFAAHLSVEVKKNIRLLFCIRGIAETISKRATDKGWLYTESEELRIKLTEGILRVLNTGLASDGQASLDTFVRAYEFQSERAQGPFSGCVDCRAICLYRSEAHDWIDSSQIERLNSIIRSPNYKSEGERYGAFSNELRYNAQVALNGSSNADAELGYCIGLHVIDKFGYNMLEKAEFSKQLANILLAV